MMDKRMDLQEIRQRLDEIDGELIGLFEARMDLCREVAGFKIETGKPVHDEQREQEKLESVRHMAHGAFYKQAAGELFSQVMTISRRMQYKMLAESGQQVETGFSCVDDIKTRDCKVVYQGVEGAYSHEASLQFFGREADLSCVPTWEDAMKAVENEDADYGVLPIENSSAGAVIDNYDLMLKFKNHIVGEVFIAANHALLGLPEAELSDISTVFSHNQALMQCSSYLNERRNWEQVKVNNTAVAAKKIFEDGDKTQAAVASETAGKLYGLKVLASSINHNKENTTRFIVMSKEPVYCRDAMKISLCFELPHKSGSLYNILGNFIYNDVNMLMIESRPIIGRNWEYRFFVDIEGNLSDAGVINALKGIEAEAGSLRILGNY